MMKKKISVKELVVTAALLALSVVVIIFVKQPLMIAGSSVAVSGALINLILLIGVMYCGFMCSLLLSITIPLMSFLITGSALLQMVPVIIPCIMLGNLVYCLIPWFIRGKKYELNLMPLMTIIGSFVKYGVMTFLIVKLILPQYDLTDELLATATVTYSTTQLISALCGAALMCVIWPILKIALKNMR